MSIYSEIILVLLGDEARVINVIEKYYNTGSSFPIEYWQGKLDGIRLAVDIARDRVRVMSLAM